MRINIDAANEVKSQGNILDLAKFSVESKSNLD